MLRRTSLLWGFLLLHRTGFKGTWVFPHTFGHLCAFCFSYFYGEGENDGCGRLLASMGVRLAFDAGEVWHLAAEKRGAEFFFHITEETQDGDLSCLKTPPLLQTHLPRFPFYNQPCRRRCISCKLEKPGPLSLGSVLIKFSCKIQLQFPYLWVTSSTPTGALNVHHENIWHHHILGSPAVSGPRELLIRKLLAHSGVFTSLTLKRSSPLCSLLHPCPAAD